MVHEEKQMTYTQEQIDGMGRTQINHCVAQNLGYKLELVDYVDGMQLATKKEVEAMHCDYTANPNDYMPIVIEHQIDICHSTDRLVFCRAPMRKKHSTNRYPRTDTGHSRMSCLSYDGA